MANARDILKKGRAELERHIKALTLEFVVAQQDLERVITTTLLSGRLTERAYRMRQRRAAREILERVDKAAELPGRRLAKEAYRLGARTAERAGSTAGEGAYSRVNREAVDLLIENLEGRLGDATNTVGRRVDDVFRREGLRAAAAQIVDEDQTSEVASRLVRRLEREGITSFEDRAGRQWQLQTYAETAIRTTAVEATNEGAQTALLSRGFDVVTIISAGAACPICEPFVDKLWSLTGRSRYPRLVKLPPFHGNCDCTIITTPESIAERRQWQEQAA